MKSGPRNRAQACVGNEREHDGAAGTCHHRTISVRKRSRNLRNRDIERARLDVRETRTEVLLRELETGELDAAMVALPADAADLETLRLFDEPFLLAVPADDPAPCHGRVAVNDVDQRRLILLEEGHCLRKQALAFCGAAAGDAPARLGATSLTTVKQMVANGYGVILLPETTAEVEVRDGRVKLLRFADPQPARTIGLAWRRTSARKQDFAALGEIVAQQLSRPAIY
jgi:LysR family transcriptional regulator, hydrogen peroxide-inducible genes activator